MADSFDVNFWEVPDWRRESTLDPRFVVFVAACLLTAAMLALLSVEFRRSMVLRSKILEVQARNERIQKDADLVRKMRADLQLWDSILEALEYKHRTRILWCRHLAAIARIVPPAVFLESLNLRSRVVEEEEETVDPKTKKKIKRIVPRLYCELAIRAVAVGENAAETATTFSRAFVADSEIGPLLESAHLEGVVAATGTDLPAGAQRFTILCEYKPLRWFDVPK